MIWTVLLLLCFHLQGAFGVRFDYLGVPGFVLIGEEVWLDCGYDLQEDVLYSVKWYKDNYEFYRYLPSDDPPSQNYNLEGVFLQLSTSNATHVHLTTTKLNSEGTYACEVSIDGPFRTVRAEKHMRVYVMPESDPVIVGVLNKYSVGDNVNVSCFFGPSKPPADLAWYINGELAHEHYVTSLLDIVGDLTEIASVESKLKFVVDDDHLLQEVVNLECVASVAQIYSESSEEIALVESEPFQRWIQSPPHEEPPTISGILSTYEVGHLVDLNCTAAAFVEPAILQWQVNDEEADTEFMTKLNAVMLPDGRTSSRLGIKFRIREDHFKEEELNLRCIQTQTQVVEKTTFETLYTSDRIRPDLQDIASSSNLRCEPCEQILWCLVLLSCFKFFLTPR